MLNDIIKLLNFEDIAHLIENIDVKKDDNKLTCYLTLKKQNCICIFCGCTQCITNDYRIKKVTHSISTGSPCIIIYKARRYKCKLCDKVFYENNPLSYGKLKSSTYTVLSVLEALRSHTSTFTSVANIYNLTKQSVMNIFDNYVECKRKPFTRIICIDEFYTAKISSTKYACVIADFASKQILDVYSSRHNYFLSNIFTAVPDYEKNNVKAIVIDMWDSYRDLGKRYFKNAVIAVDSFHVIKHLNDAITKIRLKIMRKYDKRTSSINANDMYYYMLKKFHYFFLKDFEKIYSGNIPIYKINTKWNKYEIIKYLLSIDDDLKYAYLLKEKYREFNLTADFETCDGELENLIEEFCNSHLEEYRIFGKLLNNWKVEIKTSFIRIGERRLSNGVIEGINSRIKTIIKNANGYTNFGRLRNKIIYSINKNEPILGSSIKKI